ncbi:alpha/beta hydrolase [Umezawaea beigongshangensis]|uniref:alpha/beta hydrolase n=1 Tax=Umezawaea beigongshangensis TaxID=2780383 RepID=UPI0018F1DF33|nr:alpha/beta hydrolase-fold protein [Umezawaea beigongshangensis]
MDTRSAPSAGRVSRRTVLAALGLVTTGAAVTASTGHLPAGPVPPGVPGAVGATRIGTSPVVRTERVRSRSRGRVVDLVTVLPAGVPAAGLPMSLLLHGRTGSARHSMVGNIHETLNSAVARGSVPPFGLVAVDGGDHYWHENVPGDDPMAMLLDEVPAWLRERGLGGADGVPFACAGVSMGGFGALLYGRRRTERRRPADAVAAISPALITTWQEMSERRAFTNSLVWASLDPLRHVDALVGTPVGVWAGNRDTFVEGTRRFVSAARPAVASITPGTHDDAFYRSVVADVVRFLGRHVPAASAPLGATGAAGP